jgi:hypothetical protein
MKIHLVVLISIFSLAMAFSQSHEQVTTPPVKDVLIVVDGKIWSLPSSHHSDKSQYDGFSIKSDLPVEEIDPNHIDYVTVLKGQDALNLYGELGQNGVIIIHMKKNSVNTIRP